MGCVTTGNVQANVDLLRVSNLVGIKWYLTLTFDMDVYSPFSSLPRKVRVDVRSYGLYISCNIRVSANCDHCIRALRCILQEPLYTWARSMFLRYAARVSLSCAEFATLMLYERALTSFFIFCFDFRFGFASRLGEWAVCVVVLRGGVVQKWIFVL
jgi:hypothetical protein